MSASWGRSLRQSSRTSQVQVSPMMENGAANPARKVLLNPSYPSNARFTKRGSVHVVTDLNITQNKTSSYYNLKRPTSARAAILKVCIFEPARTRRKSPQPHARKSENLRPARQGIALQSSRAQSRGNPRKKSSYSKRNDRPEIARVRRHRGRDSKEKAGKQIAGPTWRGGKKITQPA